MKQLFDSELFTLLNGSLKYYISNNLESPAKRLWFIWRFVLLKRALKGFIDLTSYTEFNIYLNLFIHSILDSLNKRRRKKLSSQYLF